MHACKIMDKFMKSEWFLKELHAFTIRALLSTFDRQRRYPHFKTFNKFTGIYVLFNKIANFALTVHYATIINIKIYSLHKQIKPQICKTRYILICSTNKSVPNVVHSADKKL